jgi:capsular polysaccharide biosynthesis protein
MVLPPHVRTTGNFNRSVVDALRNRFRIHLDDQRAEEASSKLGRRVYISRSLANKRRVRNEAEIIPVLNKHGFDYFTAESYDWLTQTRVAANADFIVANHGAGLTNILNMTFRSGVLEILDDTLKTPGCYRNLSVASGLSYASMPARRVNPRDCVHKGDVIVDPNRLDAAIESMLKRVERIQSKSR